MKKGDIAYLREDYCKLKKGDKVVVNEISGIYDPMAFVTALKDGSTAALYEYRLVKENPIVRTIKDVQKGDIIMDTYGGLRKVLEKLGDIVFISRIDDHDAFYETYTVKDLDKWFSLFEKDDTVELSMDEIAKKFKIDVDKLKITKD